MPTESGKETESARHQAGLCPHPQCIYDECGYCYECGHQKDDPREPGWLSFADAGQLSCAKGGELCLKE
jgi:hypothetical protein